jgi:uncharacterized protein YbjT (DUF2867 family)
LDSPLILVTGATGYIASRLIPRLLESGYRVRALARQPRRLDCRAWARQIEIFPGDVMVPSSLPPALEGVQAAYYLVHNMLSGRGYTEHELVAARNFAKATEQAGVEHIIYLGGLADPEQPIAPHMRSRIETGVVLRQGRVPVTEFRASVIAGSGSISFEMIRFMTEFFPIVPGPAWFNNKAQPIAVQNVIDYLCAALTHPNGRGCIFEIGGPEIVHYKELMLAYARARGLKRRLFILPCVPLWLMAWGVGLMTPVPRPIAHALIGGLSADSVVKHPEALQAFPEVGLVDFDTATRGALNHLHPKSIERTWDESRPATFKHEGFFIDHRLAQIDAAPELVFSSILSAAEAMGWQVEIREPDQLVLIHKHRASGDEWLEWHVGRTGSPTYLTQTSFFAPRGLGGFLYWYARHPFQAGDSLRRMKAILHEAAKTGRKAHVSPK